MSLYTVLKRFKWSQIAFFKYTVAAMEILRFSASLINSWLIINQVFPFARRCSSGNKFLENGKLLSFAKFTCKHSSASYKYRRDHLGEDRMKRSCQKSDSSVKHILIPREDSRLRHSMQSLKGSDYTFLYFINIFVQLCSLKIVHIPYGK